MLIILTIVGLALIVAVIQLIRYEKELRHMAQFLRDRPADSNTSLKVQLTTRATLNLAQAINAKLDEHQNERIKIARRQKELQAGLTHLSHDIRTPLSGARGYVQLLEDEKSEELRVHYQSSIMRRLDDVRNLLEQLFLFTQVIDPDYQVGLEEVDANVVFSEAALALFPQFQEQGIELRISLDDEGMVIANKEALRRIADNLIVNALCHGDGAVSIKQLGNSYRFSNRVTSFENVQTEFLFDRFYKGKEARGAQGSGLGLAIVAQLVDAVGGDISVECEDESICFTLILRELPRRNEAR